MTDRHECARVRVELDEVWTLKWGAPMPDGSQWAVDRTVWQATVTRDRGDGLTSRQLWEAPLWWCAPKAIRRAVVHDLFSDPSRAIVQGWRPVGGQPLHF